MSEEKEQMFVGCSCPGCGKPFDFVPISTRNCPFCKVAVESEAVWKTRKYEGVTVLPGWVKAFGWPFLLILGGIFALLYPIFAYHYVDVKIPSLLISIGLVFFFFKIYTNGEH